MMMPPVHPKISAVTDGLDHLASAATFCDGGKGVRAAWQESPKTPARLKPITATSIGSRCSPDHQLIGPMILPGFMMLSGSSAFLIERIRDIASPCSS